MQLTVVLVYVMICVTLAKPSQGQYNPSRDYRGLDGHNIPQTDASVNLTGKGPSENRPIRNFLDILDRHKTKPATNYVNRNDALRSLTEQQAKLFAGRDNVQRHFVNHYNGFLQNTNNGFQSTRDHHKDFVNGLGRDPHNGFVNATGGLRADHNNGFVNATGGFLKGQRNEFLKASGGLRADHHNGFVNATGGLLADHHNGFVNATGGLLSDHHNGFVNATGGLRADHHNGFVNAADGFLRGQRKEFLKATGGLRKDHGTENINANVGYFVDNHHSSQTDVRDGSVPGGVIPSHISASLDVTGHDVNRQSNARSLSSNFNDFTTNVKRSGNPFVDFSTNHETGFVENKDVDTSIEPLTDISGFVADHLGFDRVRSAESASQKTPLNH